MAIEKDTSRKRLSQLAQLCGMAPSTVSKALNDYPDVSEQTRTRVKRIAKEIGYVPNAIARTLRTKHSANIAVLIGDEGHTELGDMVNTDILDKFRHAVEQHGYDVTYLNHRHRATMNYVERCHYRNFDGVLLFYWDYTEQDVRDLLNSDIPTVMIDHYENDRNCVLSDNQGDSYRLTEYAISHGHTRIGFIHGHDCEVTRLRLIGYQDALKAHGIPYDETLLRTGYYQDDQMCYQLTNELLALRQRPTCILMPDDYAALGGIDAICEKKLNIPKDVSVIGYDGLTALQRLRPHLTTLRQDTKRLGEEAAWMMLDRIISPDTAKPQRVVVSGELLHGETLAMIKE